MQKSTNKTPSGFSLKQRLLPVILLAFAVSLTVFVFGPFDIYGTNMDQFGFSLTDFLGWNLLYALGCAAIICAILLPLRGKAFDIVYALFFWAALMLMIQGNYLNFGISSLAGDGVGDDGFSIGKIILNTAIWVLIGVGLVVSVLLFRAKYRDLIRTVGIIGMVTIIGMQSVSFAVTSLTSDVWSKNQGVNEETQYLLTYKNMNQVSRDHNVIWFVVDRFDVSYYEDYAMKECPEIFTNMDGFTYYNNMVTLYTRTYPSVPYMITGVEHDYLDRRVDYMAEAYSKSDFLKTLKKNNYNINLYTERYYCYEDARPMLEWVSNASPVGSVQVNSKHLLAKDMARLSLYRYLPVAAKRLTGDLSTPQFEQHVSYGTDAPVFSGDMKDAYDFLSQNPMEIVEGRNNFAFIHLAGCHLPNHYNQDFSPVTDDEEYSVASAMIQSFKIINLYLDQLKELGLYESATIIISGDHGNADQSMPMTRAPVSALFFKPGGSAGTELKTSAAPVTQGDIIPAIIESEGIQTDLDFGRSLFEIGENENRVRICKFDDWQTNANNERNDEVITFEITGNVRDLKNWKIVSRGVFIGYYLD